MGIATGYATMGRIGFEGRYDYGGTGNAIILAARLSSEAKAGEILIAQRTFGAMDGAVPAEEAGERQLKGFSPADAGLPRRSVGRRVGRDGRERRGAAGGRGFLRWPDPSTRRRSRTWSR